MVAIKQEDGRTLIISNLNLPIDKYIESSLEEDAGLLEKLKNK